MSLVSIIIPNYNHEPFLKERLDSIFNQTYQKFEVIILDDASTDASLTVLEGYSNHPKVAQFIVNEKNTGSPFIQWKKGIELAKGDFIWIAESDDSCALDFLEQQVKAMHDADIVVAKTMTFNKSGDTKEIKHPAFINANASLLDNGSLLYCPILNVSTTIFRAIDKQKLSTALFTGYPIIGDRVFYYEFFQHKRIKYNTNTVSYFRQEGTGLSNLETKGLTYLAAYFHEHVAFIKYVQNCESTVTTETVRTYINRFFYRVRDRLSRSEKLSFQYLKLYLYYHSKLKQLP